MENCSLKEICSQCLLELEYLHRIHGLNKKDLNCLKNGYFFQNSDRRARIVCMAPFLPVLVLQAYYLMHAVEAITIHDLIVLLNF